MADFGELVSDGPAGRRRQVSDETAQFLVELQTSEPVEGRLGDGLFQASHDFRRQLSDEAVVIVRGQGFSE